MNPFTPIRRIVTGHDAEGRAVVIKEDVPKSTIVGEGAATFSVVWTTAVSPADNNDDVDGATREVGLTCPGGSVLRIVDFAPHSRSPMHRTYSIDYGIVLSGELDLELDSGEVRHLRPGDVVIQRGTNHAWVCGEEAARMAFVLLEAEAVRCHGFELPEIHG